MMQVEPLIFYFVEDSVTPNNRLPVLIYSDLLGEVKEDYTDFLEKKFQENNWTNNWRDTILSEHHYHTTSHEVLGISKGSVDLQLGGEKGKRFQVSAGDVLIIPAGVAHRSLDRHSDYEVIGGYPEGRAWDLIFCEPEKFHEAKKRIAALPLPETDPIFGDKGPLIEFWM